MKIDKMQQLKNLQITALRNQPLLDEGLRIVGEAGEKVAS
jgi:hypothetical protein